MKRLWVVPLVAAVLALSVHSTRAETDAELAFELGNLREAWLYGDAETAAARLDTLREDNRLGGWLPRWYAFMRAWLALEEGDDATANSALEPVLKESSDARNYLRACRVYLAADRPEAAEEVIDRGLLCAPESQALLRFKAGLQWLRGEHDAAMETYLELLCLDERTNYPWVSPHSHSWQAATPWPDPDAEPEMKKSDESGAEGTDESAEPTPEPHISLFAPARWYVTDLPGLARCIDELASQDDLVSARADRLADRIATAESHQRAFNSYRGGDDERREELRKQAVRADWQARLDARVVARANLISRNYEKAAEVAGQGLALHGDDVALLDIQAEVHGWLGMAEEARTGPLARLKAVSNLSLTAAQAVNTGPTNASADRLLMPALTLYRANQEAGRQQLEQVRRSFTRDSRGSPIHPGIVGLWLYQKGEHDLAREYLLEASRFDGHDSGKPLYGGGVYFEMALLAIGDSEAAIDDEADEEGDEGAIEPPAEDDEVESVAMANVADAPPLVRDVLRAGGIMGAILDTRGYVRDLTSVDLYSRGAGAGTLIPAAKSLPGGERLIYEALYRMPERLVAEVDAAEIERWLKADSPISKSLSDALNSMSESIGQLQTSSAWRMRQALSQKAGPVFGMIEARATLLRAKLRLDNPQGLEELAAWLSAHQEPIDVRRHLQKTPDDSYLRLRAAREEAGVPEVVHRGLLLDGAQLLARAGQPAAAGELIWHNRAVRMGMESPGHLLALGSVMARKGGDEALAARCRVEAARHGSWLSDDLVLFELPLVRKNLLEFGDAADVLNFVENSVVPFSESAHLPVIKHAIPEAREARPTLFMRNPSHVGLDNIFESSVTGASCQVIERNWNKILGGTDTRLTSRRLAAWVVVSDLPLTYQGRRFAGCNSADDTARGWTMLHSLYASSGETERAQKLSWLIEKTRGVEGDDELAVYWD